MRTSFFYFIALIISWSSLLSCNDSPTKAEEKKPARLVEENVSYTSDSVTMNGFIVYSDSFEGKRPAVLVVHEWWGLNDYTKARARQLAELGYIAMAVDMFGNGKTAANPDEAMKLSGQFYGNPQLMKTRLEAALALLKSNPQTDPAKIAAIGYCFGGSVVLNSAKMGTDLNGVVSFHGSLGGGPAPDKNMKAQMLICHGADDSFVKPADIATFRQQLDSAGAKYSFISYPGSKHAFTNPKADEYQKTFGLDIAYNPEADKKSWNDMRDFLSKIFK